MTISLALQCAAAKLPAPVAEFRFAPPRKWRADFAWPAQRVLLEVDGGGWIPGGGRHSRGAGIEKDCEKTNAAAALGYRVLRVTPRMVKSGEALSAIEAVLRCPILSQGRR
jgi:very-short-patch-repair endonuclease